MKGSEIGWTKGEELSDDQIPFMVAAAHELKAPLALIRQLSLSLEEGLEGAENQRQMLRQILLTSERGLRLTSDLTRTVRLEDSLFELEPVNARQLCEDVAHELSPLYKACGRELQVVAGKRQLLAVANRDLLRRILVNFSDNALHYADARTPVLIQSAGYQEGQKIRLGVRDYGPAVSSDIWRRLKRNLGASPQAMQNRPASSGLGLYISGQFAEVMHGSIGATRHRDGATFYVDLLASQQMKLL